MLINSNPQVENFLSSRRRFLFAAAGAISSIHIPTLAQTPNFWDLPRELWLKRPSTGEEVRAVYWANNQINVDGYLAICRLLRDTHRNLAVQFDFVTLDIARGIYGWLLNANINKPLIITSGYRHPKTNAAEGGVFNSYHTRAQALDLTIQDVSVESITRFAQYLAAGGVGFYPNKRFIHVDRGNLRFWRG